MPRPRSVIVIGPSPPPFHGVSVMTNSVAAAFAAAGVRVLRLDTCDPRSVENVGKFEYENVRLALRHARQLAGLLLRVPDAAIYVPLSQGRWGFIRDAVFLVLARLARRPRIVHVNGGYLATFYRESGPLMRAVMHLALDGAAQGWVLTSRLRSMFAGLLPEERIHVVANAVEDVEIGARIARRSVTIAHVSNSLGAKGGFALLDALTALGERARGVTVALAGYAGEEERRAIEARRRALSEIGVDVRWVGVVDAPARDRLLRTADIFVLPSTYQYEGQPLVLLEAMAAGLPIVSTAHSGIPETVPDDVAGLIVARDDAAGLAGALGRLIESPELRDRLGQGARALWEEQYGLARLNADVAGLVGRLDRVL